MYIAAAIFILLPTAAGLIIKFNPTLRKKMRFFAGGIEQGFHLAELSMLWKAAVVADLEEPAAIYWYVPVLLKCIAGVKKHAETGGTLNSEENQRLLSKLYAFRTKLEKQKDEKRGINSTHPLSAKQKLRVVLPGKGVFASEIVNNAHELIIKIPLQNGCITVDGKNWVGKTINVYLWRAEDAMYTFTTTVKKSGVFLGRPVIFIEHTQNITRTQMRSAVRAKCRIFADLCILKENNTDYSAIEVNPGYKCLIEDISENGALIKIGGKGLPKIRLRLQFQLDGKLIVMFGVIHTVEFDAAANQSKLHFECLRIEPVMKNIILSYVYNILSENEKEAFEAIALTDSDNAGKTAIDAVPAEAETAAEQKDGDEKDAENETEKRDLFYIREEMKTHDLP
ncbi:MAG: PilZ domain-containing protein [Treponema sp.]